MVQVAICAGQLLLAGEAERRRVVGAGAEKVREGRGCREKAKISAKAKAAGARISHMVGNTLGYAAGVVRVGLDGVGSTVSVCYYSQLVYYPVDRESEVTVRHKVTPRLVQQA